MKKKTVIALAVTAGLILCIIIMAISAANNPKRLVADALYNTSNDVKGMYLVDYANRLINGGSVSVSGSLKPVSGKDADAQLKVYTDFSRNVRDSPSCPFRQQYGENIYPSHNPPQSARRFNTRKNGSECGNGLKSYIRESSIFTIQRRFYGLYGKFFTFYLHK